MLFRESDITIGDVIESFPLSEYGNYHIRFRMNHGDSYQWIDPFDYNAPVPKYNGGIFLKVLDIGMIILYNTMIR